jgi:L-ascorbate metabolism protein UlaG (beta-lactamase superfamily)
VNIRYLGHACFTLEDRDKTLIFDPYLDENPSSPVKSGDVKADYVLVSHAHFDHMGEAAAIAKASGGLAITTAEVAGELQKQGADTHALHIGGKHAFDFGYIRATPAFHGSGVPGGHACGFIVNFYGKRVYFPGDTGLFGDMKLLGELEALDMALLPIGDNFTMGIDDAVVAVKLLRPKVAIPMHYNTWPLIEADPNLFKDKVEAETGTKVVILRPGESISL